MEFNLLKKIDYVIIQLLGLRWYGHIAQMNNERMPPPPPPDSENGTRKR